MSPKVLLLLFGALMLIGTSWGEPSPEASSPLSIADKRRIIRDMMEAQKDIKKALLKIRHQIEGDLNATGHNGSTDDDSDDDDDIDHDMGSDEYGGMYGEEDEEFYKEQQKKIREAREHLESRVQQIISSFTAMAEYIHRIDVKVDELIRKPHDKDYHLYYNHKPAHGAPPTKPSGHAHGYGYGYGYGYGKNTGQSQSEAPKPVEDEPFRPIVGPGSGKRNKKPNRNYRTNRSLDEPIPAVETEQLSNPDIPSVVGYDGPVQETVEQNQQQVEQ